MEEIQSTSSQGNEGFENSLTSRVNGLIDIPFMTRLRENLSALFNFLDIYGPKIEMVHTVITFIRIFQLIGASIMAANDDAFDQTTLTFKAVSILTVIFHIIPVQYRFGNEYIFIYVIDAILLSFGFYLVIAAFIYNKTTTLSRFSIVALTLFSSFVTFVLIPISIQFSGEIISAYIGKIYKIEFKTFFACVLTLISWVMYT